MYARPDGRKAYPKSISVPQNYSGNAFTPKEPPPNENDEVESEVETKSEPASEPAAAIRPLHEEKRTLFPFPGIGGNDDLLLLGLILLLSQDGFGDDILPILLLILFLKK